ncbi:MAG TPA: alpha-amylase family glycosyl hydrolase [Pyrinomonadaceae bacterium]|nr:alpha-amylase family glycosyl hydrolase [Pyrinomonadaceae bacterium]
MRIILKKAVSFFLLVCFVSVFSVSVRAADFKRETIYQIITDRFYNGNSANDNPAQSSGLYDATQANWRLYWGGDLQGIQAKMTYLKDMGVTAIWISPPVDNLNLSIPFGGQPTAPYHGYQGRDFKRIEEHEGDAANAWTAFDNMVASAHTNGIKVIVDFAPNHTNQDNDGEFGAFYNNGTFVGNYTSDTNGYFHHNGNIANWDDRYQVQYYSLFNLADLNQEHATVDQYLKDSAILLQSHGVDGFRFDAVKHATWGWQYSLANSISTNNDAFMFGEWYQTSTSDPLYRDSYKFANKSGISLLDFPLNQAIRNVFASGNNFSEIDNVITAENSNFSWKEDLITFIDNHDMKRFLSVNNNNNRLHEAIAFIQTIRGIPCIYYGTEQYLHNDTSGGDDPYNRPAMPGFSTSTTAYGLIKKLSDLRKSNPALGYGSTQQRWMNSDVYIYERKFYNNVVLVAINKSTTSTYNISGLNTALPAGTYSDYLTGTLNGSSLTVNSGSGGNNPAVSFNLGANTVSVWQYTAPNATVPQIGSIGPTNAQTGVKVTIGGKDFGAGVGTVKFGTTTATVQSWSDTKIVATVPNVTNGNYSVTVTRGASVSNGINFTVLAAKLIPVTFTVNNATPTSPGDYIFLTGDTVELSNWNTTWDGAVGPMLTPNYPNWFLNVSVPAGKTINFKFIKITSGGAVTWENGANHSYTVPTSGTGFVNVNWQY